MLTNIDETELAWIESTIDHYAKVVQLNDVSIHHQIIKSVPALVAEVRRLREALNTFIEEDQSRVILVQRQMLDCMRGKVEAWEWWDEVQNYSCIEHPYHRFRFMEPEMDPRAKAYANAMSEYNKIYFAAREAVHADRE